MSASWKPICAVFEDEVGLVHQVELLLLQVLEEVLQAAQQILVQSLQIDKLRTHNLDIAGVHFSQPFE